MALITKVTVSLEPGIPPDNSSKFFVYIPTVFLSQPYNLDTGDTIEGEIISVTKGIEEIPELRGSKISFILEIGQINDRLFIMKSNWVSLFREWGLVTPGYILELRLTVAYRAQRRESLGLYTKRDFAF